MYATDNSRSRQSAFPVTTSGIPFDERGGVLRGCLDLVSGRFPRFLFGGPVQAGVLPVFHFHDVEPEDLGPKLEYLAENKYRTVRADEVATHASGKAPLDPTCVALCFDDAWASLWTIAAPLLKRYGLTAITYAIPARMVEADRCRPTINDGAGAGPTGSPFMTWPELRALHSSGIVDVQSHTDSHSMVFCSGSITGFVTPEYATTPFLNRPQLSPAPSLRFVSAHELGAPLYAARSRMSDAHRVKVSIDLHARCVEHVSHEGGAAFFEHRDWRAQLTRLSNSSGGTEIESAGTQTRAIEEELDRSRTLLNDRLGTKGVNHICLPWGVSSGQTAAALARVGYQSAFANRLSGVHAVKVGDDPYWLKRLPNKYIFRLPGRGRRPLR